MLIKDKFFGSGVYQGITFVPWAVSGFMIGIIWRWMFNGQAGVINDILIKSGILHQPFGFLSESSSSLNSVIVANVWYGVPFFTIMITAALQGVPIELYEASGIDGATKIYQFFAITVPYIKPVLVLTTLLRGIWILNFPEIIYSMTGGGPAGSSHIISTLMIEKTMSLDYGMASAIGVVIMVILTLYTVIYLTVSKFEELGDY
jgi:multiple sugar transport system permease protein